MPFKDPAAIAREALRQLAQRRLAPTPDNYAGVYRHIAGLPADEDDAWAALKKPQAELQALLPQQSQALAKAIAAKNGRLAGDALAQALQALHKASHLDWSKLIRDLMGEWETPRRGITTARKRERLHAALASFAERPGDLHRKLRELLDAWEAVSRNPPAEEADAALSALPAPAGAAGSCAGVAELLAHTLEHVGTTLGAGHATAGETALRIARDLRLAHDPQALAQAQESLRRLWLTLEMAAGDQAQMDAGLRRLVQLLTQALADASGDHGWLKARIDELSQTLAQPLTPPRLEQAEKTLREAAYRQGVLRHSLEESHASLKSMIALFIDRLGRLTDETGQYHSRIEGYSTRIAAAETLDQIGTILAEVLKDTRAIQDSTRRSHDDLAAARHRAEEAERKIRDLEAELSRASALAREDPMTGALNRAGLEQAYAQETSRAERSGAPLSLAMLDVDNFKQLNDTYGHQAGDDALRLLASVMRRSLRPTDIIARYGGEEFLILLPDTGLDAAAAVLTRVQRELTKDLYLNHQQRPLITFSAGVTLRRPGEAEPEVLKRADQGVYQAKRQGKNRVVAVAPPAAQGEAP